MWWNKDDQEDQQERINKLIKRLEKFMSSTNQGLADLQNSVSALTTAVSNAATAIANAVAEIQAANNKTGDPDADVEAAAQAINAQVAALNQAAQSVPPPPASAKK